MLLAIARHTDRYTGEAYPSIARIAKLANCTRETVSNALPRLVKSGELKVESGNGGKGGRGRVNRYTLVHFETANSVGTSDTDKEPTGLAVPKSGNSQRGSRKQPTASTKTANGVGTNKNEQGLNKSSSSSSAAALEISNLKTKSRDDGTVYVGEVLDAESRAVLPSYVKTIMAVTDATAEEARGLANWIRLTRRPTSLSGFVRKLANDGELPDHLDSFRRTFADDDGPFDNSPAVAALKKAHEYTNTFGEGCWCGLPEGNQCHVGR